jgi:hypothetical protein
MPPLYLYVAQLVKMYPFTHHTISYIYTWPEKLKQKHDDPFLIKIAKEVVNEEKGHDKLILKDLEHLKIPIDLVLREFQFDSVQRHIESFTRSVETDPLHFLAWISYAERLAVDTVTEQRLKFFQKILGPYHKAIRFWRIHSAVGPDLHHAKKREQWIQSLPFGQQQTVMQELSKVAAQFSDSWFDLDVEKFKCFINQHAPHLHDTAYNTAFHFLNELSLGS